MNPDLLKKLKNLFVPEFIGQANRLNKMFVQKTQKQLESPLADTLSALSGGGLPSNARTLPGYVYKLGRPIGGVYSPVGDAVSAVDWRTFIHEMGHRRDARSGHMIRSLLMPDRRFIVPRDRPTTSAEQKARALVDDYYQTNQKEGYAQAFEEAVSMLRTSGRVPFRSREQYAKMLAEREKRFPGTGSIVEELMREPIYANHPVRRFYENP